jgi:hypothetical protein
MANLRPYGFSRRGAKRAPRETFDRKAQEHLTALLGYRVSPVITIRNLQKYVNDLTAVIDRMWDQSDGRLSARQQKQVQIITRTQEWLTKLSIGELPPEIP